MKLLYITIISTMFYTSVCAQQIYISKKQIKIGNYTDGKVPIDELTGTYIFKTDFNFKSTLEADYILDLVSDDNEVEHQHLKLKSVKIKRTEKIYEFADEEIGDYPKLYLQIDVEADKTLCIVIKNEAGQFYFYCNKM